MGLAYACADCHVRPGLAREGTLDAAVEVAAAAAVVSFSPRWYADRGVLVVGSAAWRAWAAELSAYVAGRNR